MSSSCVSTAVDTRNLPSATRGAERHFTFLPRTQTQIPFSAVLNLRGTTIRLKTPAKKTNSRKFSTSAGDSADLERSEEGSVNTNARSIIYRDFWNRLLIIPWRTIVPKHIHINDTEIYNVWTLRYLSACRTRRVSFSKVYLRTSPYQQLIFGILGGFLCFKYISIARIKLWVPVSLHNIAYLHHALFQLYLSKFLVYDYYDVFIILDNIGGNVHILIYAR